LWATTFPRARTTSTSGIPDEPDRAILRQIPRDAGTDLAIGHEIDRAEAKAKLAEILAEVKNHPAVQPPASPTVRTGQRAAALAKCKKLKGKRKGKKGKAKAKKRKKCIQRARKLPI